MNLLRDLPDASAAEISEALASRPGLRIERIVSLGQASPPGFWYDQHETEWVVLLAGAARLRFADEPQLRDLGAGDWVEIAAHRRHRVEWTDPGRPTVWLAVFYSEGAPMTNQLPPPGAVFLDHVAHFVPGMDAAAAALENCGFRLTPFTAQTNRVGGKPVPAGTGNRCAMLREGYVEILTATADTELARQLRERIADHVGLHLAAFSSADAAAEHRRLAETGFATLPIVDMRRPVATDRGSEDARFTIARIAHGSMPEGRVQFLTHHTEPLVWRNGFLDHPNGARALTGLWIAANDPAEPAARFSRFIGRPATQAGEVTTIASERGTVHIARPRYMRDAFGITPAGTLPCFVAAQIAVTDLAILQNCLRDAGLSRRRVRLAAKDEAIAVDLPAALGGAMLFHQG
jgi:hypothetical protein